LIKASLVPQSLSSCFWKDDRVHFQENKKSFVLINQKGIDPPSLEMLAHEAGIIFFDVYDMSMICLSEPTCPVWWPHGGHIHINKFPRGMCFSKGIIALRRAKRRNMEPGT
jgi:hypothetical protein